MKMLAPNEDPREEDWEPCPGCDCEPVGYAPHNGKGELCRMIEHPGTWIDSEEPS